MGLTAKQTGKLRGMMHKIKMEEIKRKEAANHEKSSKKN